MPYHLKDQVIQNHAIIFCKNCARPSKMTEKSYNPNLAVSAINAFLFSKHKGNHFFYNKGGNAFFLQMGI